MSDNNSKEPKNNDFLKDVLSEVVGGLILAALLGIVAMVFPLVASLAVELGQTVQQII